MEFFELFRGQQTNVRGGLTQAHRVLVPAKHRRKEQPVVVALNDLSPLVMGRNPNALALPPVEVSKSLGANLARRALSYHCMRVQELELIALLVRTSTIRRRTQTAFTELQRVSLAHSPRLERGFGKDDPQGISDAAQEHPHWRNYNEL